MQTLLIELMTPCKISLPLPCSSRGMCDDKHK
jgi:hypothetical protein